MTLTLTAAQAIERCTVTLTVASAASLPSVIIVVDGKAYTGLLFSGTLYTFTYDIALERGSHVIYGYATDSVGTVTTDPITYVMAYELVDCGIDVYSGDAKLDAIGTVLHDELLPALPTLNFSCATLLTGTIQAVIRERGLRQYQFVIATVAVSNGLYQYTCKAAESYALTTAIMALQTAYGATSDAIRLIVPSLNIVNASVQAHSMVNLITNGEFGVNTAGWNSNNATLSRETGTPLVGTGSLKILSTDVDSDAHSLINIIVGHEYMATCLAKSTAGAGRLSVLSANTESGDSLPVDCSTEALLTTIFTADYPTTYLYANLVLGLAGESLIIDHVVCYDLTPVTSVDFLAQTTYPQLFANITPTEIIKQFMIQDLAQASVRNGNLYVFPLDVSGQLPDYHMQRLDPLTGWQRDADVYDAVMAHYVVRQYPTPATVLTLSDAANWTGTVTDVTQVDTTLLPVPSGALGMLKSVGNASRTVSTLFKYFDRVRFNWNPVTATTVTVSLQQDVNNKLELTHTFAGQSGAGFVLTGGAVSTDTLTKNITLDPVQFVTTVTGTMTASCSYRVTLLDAGGGTLWQDAWSSTIGSDNTFSAHVPTNVSQVYQATTVKIEFTGLYFNGTDYGVQAVTCTITIQTYDNVGSHEHVVSSTQYYVNIGSHVHVVSSTTYPVVMHWYDDPVFMYQGVHALEGATGGQWYVVSDVNLPLTLTQYGDYFTLKDDIIPLWNTVEKPDREATAVVTILETVQDYEWQTVVITETVQDYEWEPSTSIGSLSYFNLFESVDIPLTSMTRTGNPTTLVTIALAFADDNYVDSLVLVADNPLPVTVRAGTGSRAYVVTDDFGSEAGAQAYADGLLPIVSVAREQYTRDVPLSTDLSVGDTVNGDGVNMTVYAVDYRQDSKTLAAGRAMDVLMTRLAEQARRLSSLERKA